MIVVLIIFVAIVGFGAGFLTSDVIRKGLERRLMHRLKETKATNCPYEIEKAPQLKQYF